MNAMFTQTRFHTNSRHLTNQLSAHLLPILGCALAAALLVYPADDVRAQTSEHADIEAAVDRASDVATDVLGRANATWRLGIGAQTADLLSGPRSRDQQVAMRNLSRVATIGEFGTDFSAAVAPLVEIAIDGATETRRLSALQALHAIGTEHSSTPVYRRAMVRLYDAAQEMDSDRVRRAAADVLKGYFGDDA